MSLGQSEQTETDIVSGRLFFLEERTVEPMSDSRVAEQKQGRVEELLAALDPSLVKRWCRNLGVNTVEELAGNLVSRNLMRGLQNMLSSQAEVPVSEWQSYLPMLMQLLRAGRSVCFECGKSDDVVSAITAFMGDLICHPIVDRFFATRPPGYMIVSSMAIADLKDDFTTSLQFICHAVVQAEVNVLRGKCRSFVSEKAVADLVMQVNESWWRALIKRYPLLVRYLAEACHKWVQNTTEFIGRLETDIDRLLSSGNGGSHNGALIHLTGKLSDPHDGHKSVLRLQFNGSPAWYYKPRSLAPDVKLRELFSWISEHGGPVRAPRFTVINCGQYGWMEDVPGASCVDESEVASYYFQIGVLLCIAHIFNLTDVHGENIVAQGPDPVVVDGETFLTPEFNPTPSHLETGIQAAGRDIWQDSVLRTSMLPRWISDNQSKTDNSAAIHMFVDNENTADPASPHLRSLSGVPMLAGQRVGAKDFVEQIMSGFETCAQFMISKRSELLAWCEKFLSSSTMTPRLIFRTTHLYSKLRLQLVSPQQLESALATDICLDLLMKGRSADDELNWQLIKKEQEALRRLDIPFFTTQTLHDLESAIGAGNSSPIFRGDGLYCAKTRLIKLSVIEIEREKSLISAALNSFTGTYNKVRRSEPPHLGTIIVGDSHLLPASTNRDAETQNERVTKYRISAANACAQRLWKSATLSGNGVPGWVGRVFHQEVSAWRVKPLDGDLYDGCLGILAFLAVHDCSNPDPSGVKQEVIYKAAAEALDLKNSSRLLSGAARGLGGMIWGAYVLSTKGQVPGLEERIVDLVGRCHDDGFLVAQASVDALSGLAGMLLALDSVADNYHVDFEHLLAICMPRIMSEARHLIDLRNDRQSHGGTFLGVAHGLSGLTLAVSRVAWRLGDDKLLSSALEYCRYLNEEQRRWLANRPRSTPDQENDLSIVSWCNGFVGICMTLLNAYEMFGDPDLLSSVPETLEMLSQVGLSGLDGMCCGNFGRVRLFEYAAAVLKNSQFDDEANRICVSSLTRAQARGSFELGVPSSFTNPVLYQGEAGIGLALMGASRCDPLTWLVKG